jgi:hypothetical protein
VSQVEGYQTDILVLRHPHPALMTFEEFPIRWPGTPDS